MKKIIPFLALILMACQLQSQTAVKLKQQSTMFFYTQLNLHGGFYENKMRQGFDLPQRGPNNQIAFQLFSRNPERIQRGYTKLLSMDSWKIRTSIDLNKRIHTATGAETASTNLRIRDAWVKFNTKWDRTSFTIGYKSIPFGHNPKIDPVSSFMTNIVTSDLGIGQDFGLFIKTPVNEKLDLEMSLTSGGVFNQPLLSFGDLMHPAGVIANPNLDLMDLDYNGTWLVTGRIGQQSFRKNEFGMIGVAGRVPCFFIPDDYLSMIHVGGDWVYKFKERFKSTNQLVVGLNNSDMEGKFADLSLQNNLDFFLGGKFIVSLSHSLNLQKGMDMDRLYLKSTTANSLTYALTPHTRIRLNHFFESRNYSGDDNWGLTLQLVTGIGKR